MAPPLQWMRAGRPMSPARLSPPIFRWRMPGRVTWPADRTPLWPGWPREAAPGCSTPIWGAPAVRSDIPNPVRRIAVDSVGNAYVTGSASSADFPVLHPVQPERGGWMDAFAAKLSSGGALLYSTYLGGSGVDAANAIAVDVGGRRIWPGRLSRATCPSSTPGNASTGGSYDAFVAKLGPAGDSPGIAQLPGRQQLRYGHGSGAGSRPEVCTSPGWTLSTNFPW